MYPITNEVKALFESEQRKVLRITGKPLKKDNVSVGPSDIVTVNDAAAIPAKDITIGIEPVQSGSGDPSPTNVRPISGWTGANVVVSPTTDAQDGTTYSISFPNEAGTVYGGTLDVTTGLLTVTMAEVDLGTLTWRYNSRNNDDTGNVFYTINTLNARAGMDSGLICSIFAIDPAYNASWKFTAVNKIRYGGPISRGLVACSTHPDVASFQTAMSGVQLVYELATPQTYQLSPIEVKLLLGDNNVWADTGETTLTYRPYADLIITDDNVIADSFQIDRYSCNGEKLEIGTAIAAQLTLKLENGNGQYDGIVFEGAELFAEVGIADWTQSSPTVTYVPCGYFTPDEQPRRLSTISITALDRMTKFDAVVDGTQITTPITVANLVSRVCTLRGVTLAQSITGLTNANVSLPSIPTGNTITYRNLIAWCAGIMGTNAWIDWNGQLRFSWYNNATGYVSTVDNRYSSDMYENDLTVTGVVYTTTGGIDIVEGTDNYALDLTGNTLASPMISTILPALNTALNGFTYRPFTAAAVNAPYLWPMDAVTFTDKEGNDHASLLTNVCFGLNGTTAMEARGMTYVLNRQKLPEGFTKEQAQLINEVSNQIKGDIDDSLTQQDIFNRLTDNGAAQGLVLYNGQLYINASYIQSGTLVLGGLNNQNGTLKVLNAAGQEIGTWTKDGISIQRGDINLDSTGSIKVGFNADGSQYALFNNQGMNLMMDNGSNVKTGLIHFGQGYPQYPNINLGTLESEYKDGTDLWSTVIAPGYFEILNAINNVGRYDLLYDLESFRVTGPAGTFRVNSDDGEVNTNYEFKLSTPLGVPYGGTGANNKPDAISNLFDAENNQISQYPDKPGIYRVVSNIFANLTPASYYGTLVIFQSVYGLHTFLDAYGNLYYGYSGDTFGEPTTWRRGVVDSDVINVAHGGTGATDASGALKNLFNAGVNIPTNYPDKPGIYQVHASYPIFSNMTPTNPYGILVIFKAIYGMHIYLDASEYLYYGISTDTFGEPTRWYWANVTAMPRPQ